MKVQNKRETLKLLLLSSLFAALIAVLTFYIKIPTHNGYIHLGDSLIYLAACLLPAPFAVISASLGGALADTLGGYTIYIIPTLIIKALLVPAFNRKSKKLLNVQNIVALVFASAVSVAGYYIAEVVLISTSGNDIFSAVAWSSALYAIPSNIIQAVGSAVVFIFLAVSLDKINIKDRILKWQI